MTTPIRDEKTLLVANYLLTDVILKFGVPRILHSDNSVEFKSKLMENLSQQLGIRKTKLFRWPQLVVKATQAHESLRWRDNN